MIIRSARENVFGGNKLEGVFGGGDYVENNFQGFYGLFKEDMRHTYGATNYIYGRHWVSSFDASFSASSGEIIRMLKYTRNKIIMSLTYYCF